MKTVPPSGLGHLRVTLDEIAYIGPGRADLLEGIAETGSISAAGRRMKMSYRRAWTLVEALNESFGEPLVEKHRGGNDKGGASLTALGEDVLNRYRNMQRATAEAIAEDVKALRAYLPADRNK